LFSVGRVDVITRNEEVINAVKELLASTPYDDIDPLFKSKKGGKSLSVPNVNLKGNYGNHTFYVKPLIYGWIASSVMLPELTAR
jgi:hypothetical protein